MARATAVACLFAVYSTGRRTIHWQGQELLGLAFFETTALFILLMLYVLLRRNHASSYFNTWMAGWGCLTLASTAELLSVLSLPGTSLLRAFHTAGEIAAFLFLLAAIIQYTSGIARSLWQMFPLAGLVFGGVFYLENTVPTEIGRLRWETAEMQAAAFLCAGWLLWRRSAATRGIGIKLLAATFFLGGLHVLDRPLWPEYPIFDLRLAFDHLLSVSIGTAMVVLVLEESNARTEDLNDKLRRLTLLTAASTQTLSVKEVLDKVLCNLVESLGATHGVVRLLEGDGEGAELVVRSAVGFDQAYQAKYARISILEPWTQRVLNQKFVVHSREGDEDDSMRQRLLEGGVTQVVTLPLPGKEGPLGMIGVGTTQPVDFQPDEITYMVNVANLLGLTLQNLYLFEEVSLVQRQWTYTFDSIGDPVFVHNREFRMLRTNQRLAHLLGREGLAMIGRTVGEIFPRRNGVYKDCPYCEGIAGGGDDPDPWLRGYFLVSNSTFADAEGRQLGTVHVLRDISDRKRAEEKYRSLVASVQEGVFISTPQGRFLDFNEAFLRMTGYENREELMAMEIPSLYVNVPDRERLRRLLQEHGRVADFEFEMLRKDGEVRTVLESSTAVRDAAGKMTAYQGFLLDITERKRAEQEIRRRNRELMVLNSIGQTLNESLDLNDSIQRTLRQLMELFQLDASSLYLLDEPQMVLRRIAAAGQEAEAVKHVSPIPIQGELLQHIRAVHATFLSMQGLPLPRLVREIQTKEGIVSAYLVVLWSKDKIIGGFFVGSRTPREFSPADINLLIAIGGQLASAIERSLLFEEMRQAYDNLRRAQEQLLHNEKMAAVGQLISGVAHELNNPLTAILGYSQLLSSSGQPGTQAVEYAEKLYKQAQRTHRIVQNLLSFARQHKPERVPARLNQVIEDTLALRDYDLRVSNIRVHRELAPDLPVTAADPHQLQQVFLNLVNNAVDAILEHANEGDIWVRTWAEGDRLLVEFTDSGPGVKDASKVFDPFYTTKPVGKGTGLGLSICYGIITEHGGTIQVRNAPPHGAAFTIELPFHAPGKSKKPATARTARAAKEGRILLVDEDASVLEAVGEVLRGRNHFVQTAQAAERAQELLEQQEYDLVVADADFLGKRDAAGFLGWLARGKSALAKRLIVMRSAAPGAGNGNAGEIPGCRVLQKPFKATELIAVIEELLHEISAAPIST